MPRLFNHVAMLIDKVCDFTHGVGIETMTVSNMDGIQPEFRGCVTLPDVDMDRFPGISLVE